MNADGEQRIVRSSMTSIKMDSTFIIWNQETWGGPSLTSSPKTIRMHVPIFTAVDMLTSLISCFTMNNQDISDCPGQVCFPSPESQLYIERQRLVFMHHTSGLDSQEAASLPQLSAPLNQDRRLSCLQLSFCKSSNLWISRAAMLLLLHVVIVFKCPFTVCSFIMLLM